VGEGIAVSLGESGNWGCAAAAGDGGKEEVDAPGEGDQGSGEYRMLVLEKCTVFVMVVSSTTKRKRRY
jgi:hypothetical protein